MNQSFARKVILLAIVVMSIQLGIMINTIRNSDTIKYTERKVYNYENLENLQFSDFKMAAEHYGHSLVPVERLHRIQSKNMAIIKQSEEDAFERVAIQKEENEIELKLNHSKVWTNGYICGYRDAAGGWE